MNAEIVDQAADLFIGREQDGHYSLFNDEGEKVPYDDAPTRARSRYDRWELRRQGQLELFK